MKKYKICCVLLICVLALLVSCTNNADDTLTKKNTDPVDKELTNDYSDSSVSQFKGLPPSVRNSSFWIHFIDVGQGDSALVCCDGHFMLIDGGNKSHGDKVYDVLNSCLNNNHLDYLIISHMHQDHIGGLSKALTWATDIDHTFAPVDYNSSNAFREMSEQLSINNSRIEVPKKGEKYRLGSAEIEVVNSGDGQQKENDSLVILVTYKKIKCLFTGDIEENEEKEIFNDYKKLPVTILKVSHHGSTSSTKPEFAKMVTDNRKEHYAVISVGNNNHGLPDEIIINRLNNQFHWKIYRTDENGDIWFYSDGSKVSVVESK